MKVMTMKHIGKRIIWGVIFLSFQINLIPIPSIGAWIGWYLIANSVERVQEMMVYTESKKMFIRARLLCVVMLLLAIVGSFVDFAGVEVHNTTILYSGIITFLEITTVYCVHSAFSASDTVHKKEHEIQRSVYCAGTTLFYLLYLAVTEILNIQSLAIMSVIALIIFRLWMASLLYHLCNDGVIEQQFKGQLLQCLQEEQVQESDNETVPLWKYCIGKNKGMTIGPAAEQDLDEHKYDAGLMFVNANVGIQEDHEDHILSWNECGLVNVVVLSDLKEEFDCYLVGKEYRWIYYKSDEATNQSYFFKLQ